MNAHKTAMTRKGLSRPMNNLLNWSLFNDPIGTHLDYGCGKGADIMRGSVGYDPYYKPKKPALGEQFNTVTCFYVLNVVEAPVRRQIIDELIAYSSNLVAIAVRTDNIEGVPHLDGVMTKKGTFQKQFTHEELIELLPPDVEILHEKKGFVIFRVDK